MAKTSSNRFPADDFEWGDFVLHGKEVLFVTDEYDEDHPGMVGTQEEHAEMVYDKLWNVYFPEVKYYPANKLKKLPKVKVTKNTLRKFFRLETTPWELAKQGKYDCSLADTALRMGYCYRDGEGVRKNRKKAQEYFELAMEAIHKRIKDGGKFGDEVVLRNIEKALDEIQPKKTSRKTH